VSSRHFLWTLREPERALANWRRLLRRGGRVIGFDGFWFKQSPADEGADGGDAGPGIFEEHYGSDTRAALPVKAMESAEQVAEMFRAPPATRPCRSGTYRSLRAITRRRTRRTCWSP
jgi:hypothetical protein